MAIIINGDRMKKKKNDSKCKCHEIDVNDVTKEESALEDAHYDMDDALDDEDAPDYVLSSFLVN